MLLFESFADVPWEEVRKKWNILRDAYFRSLKMKAAGQMYTYKKPYKYSKLFEDLYGSKW